MSNELTAIVSAIRSQPWAIMPDYLEAIEAIAGRALNDDVLARVASDGHIAKVDASHMAMASVGTRIDGARMATIRNGIAVIPLIGAIFPRSGMIRASTDGTSLDAVMHDLRAAEASADVERIILLVDSPGGVVSGLGEAADTLRSCKKPITAFVTGNGASAAYWLASQATEMVLDRSAFVGSIGVVASVSRQEATDASGRRVYEVVSSGAPMKRPDPSTDEGRAAIQSEIDAVEGVFIADVAVGRGVSAAKVRADFGQGGMMSAERAVAAGMADRISTLEALLNENTGRIQSNTAERRALASANIQTRRAALRS